LGLTLTISKCLIGDELPSKRTSVYAKSSSSSSRKNAFSNRIVDMWNALSEEFVTCATLNELYWSRTGIGDLKVAVLLTGEQAVCGESLGLLVWSYH